MKVPITEKQESIVKKAIDEYNESLYVVSQKRDKLSSLVMVLCEGADDFEHVSVESGILIINENKV